MTGTWIAGLSGVIDADSLVCLFWIYHLGWDSRGGACEMWLVWLQLNEGPTLFFWILVMLAILTGMYFLELWLMPDTME